MITDVAWGIDIGRSSLKCVKLQRVGDRLELVHAAVIGYMHGTEDVPGEAEIRQALAAFRAEFKPKASDVICFALPGYTTFSRPIRLPQVESRKLEDVVKYEAANQIPFPLTEVQWDYFKVERQYEPGEEVEAALFAVKHEVINEYLRHFDVAKIEIDLITSAPLALFNFTRFEMDVPEQAIVVDIGADHTDLVIIDGPSFYVRNLPTAGNDITKALQEEFGIDFLQAEQLKWEVAKSRQAERIFSVMQPVLRSLADQISRSLRYYRNQTKSSSEFQHIVLLGNATKLEGMARYLGETLDMRVHGFFDIMHIDLERDLARNASRVEVLQEHLPSLAVAMGLALQGLGKGECNINFIPEKRAAERAIARKRPGILAALGLVFLFLIFAWLIQGSRAGKLEALLKDQENGLENRLAEIERHRKAAQKAAKGYGDWSRRAEQVLRLLRARTEPLELLNRFNEAVNNTLGERLKTVEVPPLFENGEPVAWGNLMQRYMPQELEQRLNDEVNKKKAWLVNLYLDQKAPEKEKEERAGRPPPKKRKPVRKKKGLPELEEYTLESTIRARVALIDRGGATETRDHLKAMIAEELQRQIEKMVDALLNPLELSEQERAGIREETLKRYADPERFLEDPGDNDRKSLFSDEETARKEPDGSRTRVLYRVYDVKLSWPKPVSPPKTPTSAGKEKRP